MSMRNWHFARCPDVQPVDAGGGSDIDGVTIVGKAEVRCHFRKLDLSQYLALRRDNADAAGTSRPHVPRSVNIESIGSAPAACMIGVGNKNAAPRKSAVGSNIKSFHIHLRTGVGDVQDLAIRREADAIRRREIGDRRCKPAVSVAEYSIER